MTISKAFTPTGLGGAHPAKGPLSVERLIRVRDELAAAAKRSDGGNLGYMMADGAKAVAQLLTARERIAELEAALTCDRCGTVCTRPDGAHYCHPERKERK